MSISIHLHITAEWNRGGPSSAAASSEAQGAKQFTMIELKQATKHFSESNLIGYGRFGPVYTGFLSDGTVVAIKRRPAPPQHDFVAEVLLLGFFQHIRLMSMF